MRHRGRATSSRRPAEGDPGREAEPRTLAHDLKILLGELAPAVGREPAARIGRIGEIWEQVVGASIADLTRVVRYRSGVLTIEVESAPLAAELETFGSEHLIGALAAEGLEGIHALRFRPRGEIASSGPGWERESRA